ncbi:hypothetical protein [Sinirhodobacter huangdaonensis]|uniref:Uncharacterized protein n=1 Tax=Paenirhodobacter huangdaonensis TaxID=2501515 RepID=A0A3S3MR82_9RHOB|nr:hypothetical protein [Sinirhodobacter huangdaonensis]RWR53427.1 hypothetical protein EOW66_06895 [Sinirhodobacter huangdaonensis]
MLIKGMTLFLVAMAVLAIFGKLRLPGGKARRLAGRCPACGRPKIGPGPCPCGRNAKKGA